MKAARCIHGWTACSREGATAGLLPSQTQGTPPEGYQTLRLLPGSCLVAAWMLTLCRVGFSTASGMCADVLLSAC
jgi:hypothetical protein